MPVRKRKLQVEAALQARKQLCAARRGTIKYNIKNAVHNNALIWPEVVTVSTPAQTTPPDTTSRACQVGILVDEESSTEAAEDVAMNLDEVAENIGLPSEARLLLLTVVHPSRIVCTHSGPQPQIHNSTKSWNRHYTILSFMVNGHLHAEYEKLSGMLGLPYCSQQTWLKAVEGLEVHVSQLAEWTCEHLREKITSRGDKNKWIASFDGFYLTRGHYSNNCSATVHDHQTGGIAWYTHRTKRGAGHNWEGTSAGAEGDMFDELMGKIKDAGFVVQEVITDKDSSMNAIYCKHFPEGTITYCANHCAKTMHKDLF